MAWKEFRKRFLLYGVTLFIIIASYHLAPPLMMDFKRVLLEWVPAAGILMEKISLLCGPERNIPLVPWTIAVYLSFYFLLVSPVFFPDIFDLRRLLIYYETLVAVYFVAYLVNFVVITDSPRPIDINFDRGSFLSADWWINLVYSWDRTDNAFPSTHVMATVVTMGFFRRRVGWPAWLILWIWAISIYVSVLTVKQHFLLDVVVGMPLGIWVRRRVAELSKLRMIRKANLFILKRLAKL